MVPTHHICSVSLTSILSPALTVFVSVLRMWLFFHSLYYWSRYLYFSSSSWCSFLPSRLIIIYLTALSISLFFLTLFFLMSFRQTGQFYSFMTYLLRLPFFLKDTRRGISCKKCDHTLQLYSWEHNRNKSGKWLPPLSWNFALWLN